MPKTQTKAKAAPVKKQSYWTHAPLLAAIEKHIQSGILTKSRGEKTGLDYLHQEIEKEFRGFFSEGGHKFTKFSLRSRLPSLVWNKERQDLLGQYISEGWDLDGFHKRYAYLPKEVVHARVRQLRGKGVKKQPATEIQGLFRLIPEGVEVKPITIPATSLKKPFILKSDGASGLMVIHAPSIGLPYDGHMSRNALRCALEVAAREGMTALFTGGLFHMRLKQASGNTQNYRARTSSMDLDLDIFPPDYRETVEKGMKEGGGDFPIFISLAQRFENLRYGLKKNFCHSAESGGKPRFPSVPMYFALGMMEELLITIAAYHEVRHRVLKRQAELGSEMRELNALWRPLQKDMERVIMGDIVEGEAHFGKLEEQMNTIEDKLESKRRERSNTIITNTHDQDHIHAYEKVRSWLIAKLQDAMPGVTIVGYASSFVKYKDAVIEIAPVGGEAPSVTTIDKYIQSAGTDKTRFGNLPDAILLANQMSPHTAMTFITEMKLEGGKTRKRDVPIVMLPATIDGDYVSRKFKERGLFGGQTRAQQMVNHPLFQPGVVVLDRVSETWTFALYSIPAIQHLGGPLEKGETWQKRKGSEKYVNLFNSSDLHFGHPWMVTIWDGKEKRLLDQTSAVIEIFRKNEGFGRVHFSLRQDDLLQGLNFANYLQPHANLLSFGNYQEYVRRVGAKATLSEGEFARAVLLQKMRSGLYREQEQLEMLIDMLLRPNLDHYADVILTFQKSGIDLAGVSRFEGEVYNSKDIGVITEPNGNHHRNTPRKGENQIGEGFLVTEILKGYLAHYPAAKPFASRLFTLENNLVRAPMHGQEFLGLGVVDTKKGARFGLHMRGYPARKGPANGFPLENAARNVVSRGNFDGIFHSVETEIVGTGDIHKGAVLWGPKLLYYSCPAATSGDPFGDRGFAQSHTGTLVVSYPADGVGKAPIRFTFLMTPWIESWFERRFPVDVTKILPTPA